MNKSESKYFNTAAKMDEALIFLLEKKDLEYITVKEICEKAGVNRSTFYLHYETISDLVNEALDNINQRFISYFSQSENDIIRKIKSREPQDLIFISRDYLLPYLQFIKDNKKVYRAAFRNPGCMQAHIRYGNLKKNIIEPVLEKFNVPAPYQHYYTAYYIEGIMAIIKEWLNQDCSEDIETIAHVIEQCVRPKTVSYEKQNQGNKKLSGKMEK